MTGWSTDTQHRASQTVFLGTSTSQVTTGYQPCSSTNVSICAKVSPVLEWIFRTQDFELFSIWRLSLGSGGTIPGGAKAVQADASATHPGLAQNNPSLRSFDIAIKDPGA